jgi:hypothetical protein
MRVALLTTFVASRKEPLAEMLQRIHQAFSGAGLGEPAIRFNFGDGPLGGRVSSVDRVLKRHPQLARFVTSAVPVPLIPGARRITNDPLSPAAGEAVSFSTLHAIAAGVPRSFPFHDIAIHFYSPEFGELFPTSAGSAEMMCGILVSDSWWVNGRNRSLSACTLVEADPAGKKLPSPPGPVAAVLAALGKIRRAVQAPLWCATDEAAAPGHVHDPVPGVRTPMGGMIASANPEAARAVQAITADYRARLQEIVERAALAHLLPAPGAEAYRDVALGATAGPKKPALERVFKPMGYSCRGESGSFTLRRRTATNLTVELHLDVGTWGHQVLAMFRVWGLGFKGLLSIPVSANAIAAGQYPIGDADRWQKIVENLGAVVRELDRSLVPEIEAAVGPSPEWYQPEA